MAPTKRPAKAPADGKATSSANKRGWTAPTFSRRSLSLKIDTALAQSWPVSLPWGS
jgi:hypothetical protein